MTCNHRSKATSGSWKTPGAVGSLLPGEALWSSHSEEWRPWFQAILTKLLLCHHIPNRKSTSGCWESKLTRNDIVHSRQSAYKKRREPAQRKQKKKNIKTPANHWSFITGTPCHQTLFIVLLFAQQQLQQSAFLPWSFTKMLEKRKIEKKKEKEKKH